MAGAELLMIGFFSLFGTVGGILFFGAIRGWKWLVNPDECLSRVYSQAFLKKMIGKKGLRAYTLFIGVLFFIISICGIVKALTMPDDNWAF
ncbi:Imm17 family immunity protein [Verrucomicrobiota bacterium]